MLRHLLRFKNIQCLMRSSTTRNLHDSSDAVNNSAAFIKDSNKSVSMCGDEPLDIACDKSQEQDFLDFQESKNPLLPDSSFSGVSPLVSPSFNLATYVNKSELLQNMIKLGVSIHQWEKLRDVHSWVMTLEFTRDVKPIIQFLVDQGVSPDQLGAFFTKNPYILQTSVEDLEIRTNYLHSKNFTPEMISRIYSRDPFWLLFRY